MAKDGWIAETEAAMERDPRYFRVGYLTGSSSALDGTCIFLWFKTIEDLVENIVEAEPRVYDVDGDDLGALQGRLRESLTSVADKGLNEEARNNVSANGSAVDSFVIHWWGTFDELVDGSSAVSVDLIDSYTDGNKKSLADVPESELDDFVDYLKTCYI